MLKQKDLAARTDILLEKLSLHMKKEVQQEHLIPYSVYLFVDHGRPL